MSSLSVLYVIRNEEALIERSLSSVQDIADEIIIVDAQSSDRTLQQCRKFRKIKIFSYNWVHDFSKSRNFGLRQCTKNWVLYIDGDELLGPHDAASVKSAITSARSNVFGFAMHIKDYEKEWGHLAQHNPAPFFSSPQVRVFRNDERIKFEGPVGESVSPSIKRAGLGVDTLDASIHHFLWKGKDPSYKFLKLRYYNKLGATYDIQEPATGTRGMPEPPAVRPQTAIAIVAFNALSATKRCIESVSKNTSNPYEYVMVDNGSTDGTENFMTEAIGLPPIRVARNTGVAHGRNLAAKKALENPYVKYVCFLDNDTEVFPGWLEEMTALMDANPEIGIIGPMSSSANDPQAVGNQYPGMEPRQIAEKCTHRNPRFFKVSQIDRFCMLARASSLGQIGLFDESFGIYGCEEYDLCRRIKQAGLDVAIANRVFVSHAGGTTMRSNKMKPTNIIASSLQRYRSKWELSDDTTSKAVPKSIRDIITIDRKKSKTTCLPKTSVVIVAHNRIDMSQKCISSILDNTDNIELIFVDNGSTDGTGSWIENIKNATVIKNDKNLGVPAARNQGIRASTGDFVVLMDNDIIVKEGWLDDLFDEIKAGADIVGVEAWKLGQDFGVSHRCFNKGQEFSYLGGACCIFRRKVFEKIGLLDEGFGPAYYEDVDICVRAIAAGLRLRWTPTAKIVHKEHQTLVYGQKDFNYQDQLSKSYARFARKMRGEIVVEHEMMPPRDNRLKIMYLGMQWDYGFPERGPSFEHTNFFPALREWDKAKELIHFDFVDLGKKHGVHNMSTMLLQEVEKTQPDAIFAVFFDENHDPRKETLKYITTSTPVTTIGWFCDSHWRYTNFDRPWMENLDFNVTTSASAYSRYLQDGFGPKIIKSQWAAAPGYRKIPGLVRDINASFVGQPHGNRRQVVDQLRKSGVNLQVYGTGWEKRLNFDEMVSVFNRSKINLNLSNASDARFKQIKGRNFEVPACGGLLFTEMAENLSDYYEPGKEIVAYESISQLPDLIRHYLTYEDEREAIAEAGYLRTMREHTYAHRFDYIFSKAGLL